MQAPGEFHARDHAWHPPALTPAYKTSITRSPGQPLLSLPPTLSEITGPTFGQSDLGPLDHDLLLNFAHGGEPIGERIIVHGRVTDQNGRPVPGVLVEVWQANAAGRYNHPEDRRNLEIEPDFKGWGRVVPDFETGVFSFETVKPGPVPGPDGHIQAPHLSLWLVARGINLGLNTRMYFGDEEKANSADPVLARIGNAARRQTLIAGRDEAGGPPVYRFDIHLQGASETVFFDI